MKAFVFPGQGSQSVGMGASLFDDEEFRRLETRIDDVLGYSVRDLCLKDKEGRINRTEYTQPCLYVVNALHHRAAIDKGLRPQFLAGHSLGEYNALLAAGVFDLLTGLRLVKKRGELMGAAAGGGMAAVVGIPKSRVGEILRENRLDTIDVANFNAPLQTVIAGPVDDIERAGAPFQAGGAQACVSLPVSAAFHSRYMKDAAEEFGRFLSGFDFNEATTPVICNVTARPYSKQGIEPARTAKELLVAQMCSPVQWTDTVLYLTGRGVTQFHEIGPGNILERLIQKIQMPKKATSDLNAS